jgi:DNA mismatch repair protein MutS
VHVVNSHSDEDVMVIDSQTLKDLEIFQTESAGTSLFDLCDFTRNLQGAQALKNRMQRPWSNPDRIRSVQDSLLFIQANRKAFDTLPTFVTTELVESYFTRALPLSTSSNILEFIYDLLEVRFGDYGRYTWIQRGVGATASLISKLRSIIGTLEFSSAQGELAEYITEIRTLLARPSLEAVIDHDIWSLSPWKILKTDQIFRLSEKQTMTRLMQLIYEIDALVSMADATYKHGFIMPEIASGPLSIKAEGVVHPLIEDCVANPAALNQERRLLFLTGPNMAGKTTYLRACAIAIYLGHLGMGVPATAFSFVPAQRLFSSITLADNLRLGVSFFRAEGLRVKAIAQAVADGYSVIALMDEPFKGTNVKDALDASRTIMESFANKEGNLFMFSSHLIELCDQMKAIDNIDCRYFEAHEYEGRLRFDFLLQPGVSSQRLGMRVLAEEGIFELLDNN